MKKLPDLHKQAFKYKNKKRLQHDGGRAWIKDSQLFESRKGVTGHFETVKKEEENQLKDLLLPMDIYRTILVNAIYA
jgi:hypothetical protein